METEPWTTDRLVSIENEVARDEQRLESLERSIRAMSTELAAAADSRQFDRHAFVPWMARRHGPGDQSAVLGAICGLAAGALVSVLVSLFLRVVGR
jgi:hypothetical protein